MVEAQAEPPANVIARLPGQPERQKTEEGYLMTVLHGDPSRESHDAIRFKVPPRDCS